MRTPASSTLHGPPSPARRWLRRGRRLASLLMAAWLGRWVYLHLTLKPTPRPEYWAAQIAALDPPPKGAVDLKRLRELADAFAEFDADPTLPQTAFIHCVDAVLLGTWDGSRADIAAVSRVLESAKFAKARQQFVAATRAGWYGPPDLSDYRSSIEYLDAERWLMWFGAHGRWALRQRTLARETVEDWLSLLRLARQVSRSHMYLDVYYASWIEEFVALEMIATSKESPPQIDVLTLATEIDHILGEERNVEYSVRGERYFANKQLESWYVRGNEDWLSVSAWTEEYWHGLPAVSRGWNLASPIFFDFATAQANLDKHFESLAAYDNVIKCVNAAPPAGSPSIHPLSVLAGWPRAETTQHQLQVGEALATRGALDAGVTMLALNEFHRVNFRYPDRLDELVPGYLPRLPIDYADRRALRYGRTSVGFVLYSVGIDGVDNGGTPPREKPERYFGRDRENTDLVFSNYKRRPLSQ